MSVFEAIKIVDPYDPILISELLPLGAAYSHNKQLLMPTGHEFSILL